MKLLFCIAITVTAIAVGACGTDVASNYPTRLIGADGQVFVLDELVDIAHDPNLADDSARREAFRALGIQDEALIEALLDL